MSAPMIDGSESADELTWLGFAFAHVALYRHQQRMDRIARTARSLRNARRRQEVRR